ncbi:hypothetical protein LJE86_03925 [bacterium BMS3Abin03]|jgi:hypothetical protein|nr:hypothetical protein [bacterium BMS3Abin03]
MKSKNQIPLKIKRRLELFDMFYQTKQSVKRRWARIFSSSFNGICKVFEEKAESQKYLQEIIGNDTIIWSEKNDSIRECMFCFINDLTDFKLVKKIFLRIEKYKPTLTYAIVHQKKDGEGTYDIFRFSKFSYLEHCNRVKLKTVT